MSLCWVLDCDGGGCVKSDIDMEPAGGGLSLSVADGSLEKVFSAGSPWQESLRGYCGFSLDLCETQNVIGDFLVSQCR